jgi:hypothetical protein
MFIVHYALCEMQKTIVVDMFPAFIGNALELIHWFYKADFPWL